MADDKAVPARGKWVQWIGQVGIGALLAGVVAPGMTPDGSYLAFYAWASNLVAGDTNAVQDLFFYERATATVSRLSLACTGGQANDRSGDSSPDTAPALSADGRYVAFHSAASNQLGDFDLQAPLLYPADALEPDDSFDAPRLLPPQMRGGNGFLMWRTMKIGSRSRQSRE